MAAKPAKQTELKPWDRRPWPAKGDKEINVLYASVGRALSEWEVLEDQLSLLFSAFVAGFDSRSARRAYVAVRTFEGRADMLRATSESFFDMKPNEELLQDFKSVLSAATCYAPRRNDIAHGVVDYWQAYPPKVLPEDYVGDSWALYPSFASFKDRDVRDLPKYCYTAVEIDYFKTEFEKVQSSSKAVTIALTALGLFQAGAIGPLSP
jgi:hypothetical protein